ncbi:MAG: nicotinate-nucleotide adenylyltransferase [Methylophagaceae bacterium]|jgi:nicotinate-nucleotide adenylyltransferase
MADAIGILGGTFDPVHFGHLRSALEVCEQLNLAHVRLIPSARPPHRTVPHAKPQQRLMMLHLAMKNADSFIVDDRELQRDGMSYSVDTLLSLRQDFPENPLYLLLGTDAFLGIQTWHKWQGLLELAHIVVIGRPDETLTLPTELNVWYQQHLAKPDDAQTVAGKIWPVTVTQLAISATAIRALVLADKSPQFLLPDAVIQLINQLGLYRSNE